MNRIEQARELLGDDYAIVPIETYNQDVEEYKKLKAKLKQAEEDIETAYSYICQTDREIHKRQLLNALKSIRE